MVLKMKAIRVLIAILVTLSCIVSSLSVVMADTEPVPDVETNVVTGVIKAKDSYSSYLSKYENAKEASNDIVCDLGGVSLESELKFKVNVEQEGLYALGMSYKTSDKKLKNLEVAIKVDGEYPYSNMKKMPFARAWTDTDGINADEQGNEYVPEQVLYNDYFYVEAFDETLEATEKFMVYLTAGEHTVTISRIDSLIEIDYFKFAATAEPAPYKAPADSSQYYKGEAIILEGEDANIKSNYYLVGSSEQSTDNVTPSNPTKRLINYTGTNWSKIGETLVWETPEVKAGYYQIAFSFRQNTVIGAKSYRTLKIDGVSPFKEANNVGFVYGDEWQQSVFADEENKPYLIYLSEGKHQISMTVTSSDMSIVRTMLTDAVAIMGDLYVDITKITGETVDIYRDYELFKQIPDMEERLINIKKLLQTAAETMLKVTGQDSGSNYSVIMNMIRSVDQMLNDRYVAHRYKGTYYSNYCSVSSVLLDLRSMPLQLDKIALFAPEDDLKEAMDLGGFFDAMLFSTKRFFISFIDKYNSDNFLDDDAASKDNITIWVNWGRDQAQVLSALINRKFTPQTGIKVNLKLVNASIIQAVLSGKGPDCVLQHPRTEPVNLAMRGVLYDLTQFSDYEEVLDRFQETSSLPYWYKGGLYGLPDTQGFFVMFYRKDILAEYGIEIPETWDDFNLAAKLLMRNNMDVCMPTSTSAESLYPSLLIQNGFDLYSEDGHSTNLMTSDAAEIFEQWTNYYTKLKVPITMDFYNRFRTGVTPLGIANYTLYTTLKVAAPEIDGLWGMTKIPGTPQADGTVSHKSVASGSASSILKMTKNPEGAWEFLKWWTSADTQLSYSNDVETILGPSGRVPVANKEALENLSWDEGALEPLIEAREEIQEIPEYPGSYYVQRSIYQAYWNVVSNGKNTKDMMMKFGMEANNEIARKWKQYTNRKN